MDELWIKFQDFLTEERLAQMISAVVVLIGGLVLARILGSFVTRVSRRRLTTQHAILAGRGVNYLVIGLTLASALRELGVDLSLLVGAAGILTVALGFASQTSVSNLISGLFLMAEGPLAVGDSIRVGDTTGEVLSIDLLSVKLRTFDNLFVRIPNETMLKAEIVNLTRFPIRRVDLPIGVAYDADLRQVEQVLMEVAARNPIALDEPKPQLFFLGFGDSSINFKLAVWASRENFLPLNKALQFEIKEAFDAAGIEIPFPQRTVTFNVESPALPIALPGGAKAEESPRLEAGAGEPGADTTEESQPQEASGEGDDDDATSPAGRPA